MLCGVKDEWFIPKTRSAWEYKWKEFLMLLGQGVEIVSESTHSPVTFLLLKTLQHLPNAQSRKYCLWRSVRESGRVLSSRMNSCWTSCSILCSSFSCHVHQICLYFIEQYLCQKNLAVRFLLQRCCAREVLWEAGVDTELSVSLGVILVRKEQDAGLDVRSSKTSIQSHCKHTGLSGVKVT